MGSGAVFAKTAPYFNRSIGADVHQDLMMMWKALTSGWEPPRFVSKDEYQALRNAPPSPLRGLVGFGASFGGKWFGGYVDTVWDKHHKRYTKPYLNTAVDSLLKLRPSLQGSELIHSDYKLHSPGEGWLVYCDPPYRGTTQYSSTEFNHDEFWETAGSWVERGARVIVSEACAPEGWTVLADRTRRHMLKAVSGVDQADRVEILFRKGEPI